MNFEVGVVARAKGSAGVWLILEAEGVGERTIGVMVGRRAGSGWGSRGSAW